jgi:hypothetical protein
VPIGESLEQSAEADEAVAALQMEFNDAQDAVLAEMATLPTDAEQDAFYLQRKPDSTAYARRFRHIADDHPRTKAAARALAWIVTHAPKTSEARSALERLVADHVDEEIVDELCHELSLQYDVSVTEALVTISTTAHRPDTRVWASYCLARHLLRFADAIRAFRNDTSANRSETWRAAVGEATLPTLSQADPSEQERTAEALLRLAERDGSDVTRRGRIVADMASAALFELRQLAVGEIAPDIEGEDIEGRAMKLSDYRGKVVLLDFWGHW